MPRRPPPGRCIHCLKEFSELEWDHILPDSWYPDTAKDFEKWEVPACSVCNRELGRLEENLLTKLGLCLDSKDWNALGIPDRVLRSLDPDAGRDERDSFRRRNKREKFIKATMLLKELPKQGIFPDFGPLPNVEYREYPTVPLDQEEIKKFANKIVRGLAYLADKSFIEDTYDIELFVLDEDKAVELRSMVDKNGVAFDRRPGFVAKRLLIENDPVGGIYFIDIWARFKFYTIVSPKGLMEKIAGA